MTTPAAPKAPRSEAAQIINRLQLAGMKRVEIARQVGVSTDVLKHIMSGHSTGDTYLLKLRALHQFAPHRATVTSATATPAATPASASVPNPGASSGPTSSSGPAMAATAPTVEAVEAPKDERTAGQKFKDNLTAALLGKGETPLVSASKKGGSTATPSNDELVDQLVPTMALLVVIVSQLATPAQYVAVDPTHAEAAAMLTPLVRIVTRQMDAAGQLTETQMDLIQFLLATGVYGQRAFQTYRAIRAREAEDGTVRAQATGHGTAVVQRGGQPQVRDAQPERAPVAVAARDAGGVHPDGNGHAPAHARPDGANGVGKADPFASLYQQDADGRRRLGIN